MQHLGSTADLLLVPPRPLPAIQHSEKIAIFTYVQTRRSRTIDRHASQLTSSLRYSLKKSLSSKSEQSLASSSMLLLLPTTSAIQTLQIFAERQWILIIAKWYWKLSLIYTNDMYGGRLGENNANTAAIKISRSEK